MKLRIDEDEGESVLNLGVGVREDGRVAIMVDDTCLTLDPTTAFEVAGALLLSVGDVSGRQYEIREIEHGLVKKVFTLVGRKVRRIWLSPRRREGR